MKDLELYIHIPFCKSKCYYCDFCSTSSTKQVDEYLDALICENNNIYYRLNDYVVKSIFIGGGTPTLIDNLKFNSAISNIISKYNLDIKEFTVEANPDTITEEKLKSLVELGVNRISIGVQTLNDNILKILNRVHDSSDAINAVKLAKKYINNVSIDMMIGLPNQTYEDIEYLIKTFSKLGVEHISCYTLQLEDKTVLKKKVDNKEVLLPSDDETAKMYDFSYRILKEEGYSRYEISNFAKNNKYSKHNYGYWTRANYLGIGVSSHSLIDNYRFSNTNNLVKYINGSEYQNIEKLNITDQILEEIMLNFRTAKGLNIKQFNEKYQINFKNKYQKQLNKLKDYLDIKDDYVSIKEDYFEISNSIIVEFIED